MKDIVQNWMWATLYKSKKMVQSTSAFLLSLIYGISDRMYKAWYSMQASRKISQLSCGAYMITV